ncbi:unnamed protein product [Protopolystoma xenopodis]|uniref:Uncharacterized protein n=1 Tax=Protopolystoma xenopodis TaxID=117903 RepID=A0A3S5C0A0_9PLAT|nr:unnamed protein product [Protopolystoma xenopodis]
MKGGSSCIWLVVRETTTSALSNVPTSLASPMPPGPKDQLLLFPYGQLASRPAATVFFDASFVPTNASAVFTCPSSATTNSDQLTSCIQ